MQSKGLVLASTALGTALVVGFGGCSERNGSEGPVGGGGGPIYSDAVHGAAAPGATPVEDVAYYGGPVLSNVKIYAVFWGTDVTDQTTLSTFYQELAGSPYLEWLSEYDTPTQQIKPGSFGGSFVIQPVATPATVTNEAIQVELIRQFTLGTLPAPDADSLYMIHFPAGITVTSALGKSCSDYCAYHADFNTGAQNGSQNVYYGVVPDDGACPRCYDLFVRLTPFQGLTQFASHEVLEAITDPAVSTGPHAWVTKGLAEIADLCVGGAGNLDQVGRFTVQKGWSNRSAACVSGASTSGGEVDAGGGSSGGEDAGGGSSGDGGGGKSW